MADPNYSFPAAEMGPMDSSISLNHGMGSLHAHGRSYSASIASSPVPAGQGPGARMLEDLRLSGLGDMSFNIGRNER